MSGSRKGEHRGGARPGHIRKTAKPKYPGVEAMRGKGGRPPRAKNKIKPRIDPEVMLILNKREVS